MGVLPQGAGTGYKISLKGILKTVHCTADKPSREQHHLLSLCVFWWTTPELLQPSDLIATVPSSVWKSASCVLSFFFFSFPQTVWFPVAIKEDFLFADMSLVEEGGPRVRGPPWTQLRPFSPSPSLGTLSRMPTLTPTCLLFGMYFHQPPGQWGLNKRQDVCWFF